MPNEKTIERDQIVKIINSVVSKVEATETISKETIFQELKSLQNIINEARKDLGFTGAGDISEKHIPTATDELDAVVEATAGATGTIMDVCEDIEEKCEAIGTPQSDEIAAQITRIYEACSFQDITGQRITKVVATLKSIEEKVNNLLGVLERKLPGLHDEASKPSPQPEATGDAALLNGPQMPDKAISQDDIDSLLDDLFD